MRHRGDMAGNQLENTGLHVGQFAGSQPEHCMNFFQQG
jgi:hypothetical protein